MTADRSSDGSFVDLEIRIFPGQNGGYPVEITLGEQQEFPRGTLASDVVPWVPSTDPAADGRRRRFKHVAVQLEQDSLGQTDAGSVTGAVQTFLEQYFQDAEINVFWGSVQQFVAELRERWEERRR